MRGTFERHLPRLPIVLLPAKTSQSLRSMARTRRGRLRGRPLSPRRGGTRYLVRPGSDGARAAPAISSTREAASVPAGNDDPGIPPGVRIDFEDVAESAGVHFRHFDGRVAKQYLMDTTGPGLAWLDYDGDGLFDLFLVQGSAIVGPPPSPPPTSKLYRNEGGGRFRDVTQALGVALVGCGQGAAVGDIDNDGDPDLFVTFYGRPNALYRNEAGRRFVEVAAGAGLASPPAGRKGPNWTTSAAFLDYDADGFLDLFVCNYVEVDLGQLPGLQDLLLPARVQAVGLLRCTGTGETALSSTSAARPESTRPRPRRSAWWRWTWTMTGGRTSSSPMTRCPTSSSATWAAVDSSRRG